MQNAVLVTFNTSLWPIERQDKQMTRAATEKLDLGSNSGVWKKYRANPKSEKWRRIKRIRGAVFNHVIYKFTLPWAPNVRLCSAEAIEEIQAQIADFEAEFTDAVADFVADRDEIIAAAREKFGEYFNESEYADLYAESFDFRLTFTPVPQADFAKIADIVGAELAQKLADDMVNEQNRQLADASRDIWNKLETALSHAVKQLSTGDRLHDSVLGNLKELAGLMPLLNVTNDQDLEARRKDLNALLRSFQPHSLKGPENQANRKSCADQVADILAKLP
jgi:hypothetical protein